MDTKILWVWNSTLSWVMIGCIDLIKCIFLIKHRKLLAVKRIKKCYLLTGWRPHLWHHRIQWLELLDRRKGETEEREGIERYNVWIRNSVMGSVKVGIVCFVGNNSIDNSNQSFFFVIFIKKNDSNIIHNRHVNMTEQT